MASGNSGLSGDFGTVPLVLYKSRGEKKEERLNEDQIMFVYTTCLSLSRSLFIFLLFSP
jgi:hypothetical protein